MITTTKKVGASCLKHSLLFTALVASQQAFATDCTSLAPWSSNTTYNKNNQVQHKDIAYNANWWTLGEAPDQYSNPFQQWSKLGNCDTDQPQPQVSLTSPLDGASLVKNDNVVISSNASSTNGAVQQVAFLVDDVEVFVDNSAPYTTHWTALLGNHVISARATDSTGATSVTSVSVSVLDVVDNKPPAVALTSPSDSSQINEGDVVSLTANASDSDGSISNVDFYVDDVKVGSATGAPFEVNWTAVAGVHSFKAVATDDDSASTTSATVTVSVSDGKPGGGCIGVPTYVAGNSYQTNDEVQNNNKKYSCTVGGWCSSNAAWAYEPGVGEHWGDAWTDLGLCAIGPEVSITSPADSALLAVGSTVSVTVDAADGDGTVDSVEFFAAGTSVHTDTTAPYSANWTVSGLGEVQLKAIATDNDGNTGDATVLVNVTDETLIASLTSPASGTTVTLGKTIALTATATSIDSVVDKVEFVVNGSVVATDTTSPYNGNWTPGSTGQYSVSAKATDANGQTALTTAASVNVITTPVNGPHQLIGYWHNFINGSGCPIELSKISTKWDVIDIAFADNDRNSNGTVHFNLFAGKEGCAAIDPAQFKLDIGALVAQGKQVVLSLGGAEGTITLNTAADEANFVSSLTALINEWGFSGLDIDLESGSNLVHGSQIQARLPRALKAIEANTGGDMYLTMAPEHPYVHGGMIAYSGIWGAYIPLIDELRGTLDLLHVQLYNNSGLSNPYTPNAAPEGSVDMMVASVRMLVEGFELADGSMFAPLRADQVAIGLPSGPSSANSGQAPTQNIVNALDCIAKGTGCGSIVPLATHPTIGGVMTWSINWDAHDGFNFSGPIGDKIDAMNAGQ